MVEQLLKNQDPIKQMHVLWAIQQIIAAWQEVTPKTIKNCFIKSMLFGSYIGPRPYPQSYIDPPIVNKLQAIAGELQAAGRIHIMANIQDFIKLLGEKVEDLTEDLIKHIAELYIGPDRDAETDEEVIKQL